MPVLIMVALASSMASLSFASSGPPSVHIPGLGTVKGTNRDSVSNFLGIPYAAPPIQELRWQPPQPAAPFGNLEATEFGDACIQGKGLQGYSNTSEACLYLNVFAPTATLASTDKLPVMLWVHGGAYTEGASNDYDGNGIIQKSNYSVIVVTINYRFI